MTFSVVAGRELKGFEDPVRLYELRWRARPPLTAAQPGRTYAAAGDRSQRLLAYQPKAARATSSATSSGLATWHDPH